MNYRVIKSHRSEAGEPLSFRQGDKLIAGEKYQGPEGWEGWYYCIGAAQTGGWVPRELIHWLDEKNVQALEDYSSKELDVDAGDVLVGDRQLNGWVWCRRPSDGAAGWVPLDNLQMEAGLCR